jgi:magnesium chelatase subunit I
VEWFDAGGIFPLEDTTRGDDLLSRAARIPGLVEGTRSLGVSGSASSALKASAVEFLLEGLAATKRISRSDDKGFTAAETPALRRQPRREEPTLDDLPPVPGGTKKKYYN